MKGQQTPLEWADQDGRPRSRRAAPRLMAVDGRAARDERSATAEPGRHRVRIDTEALKRRWFRDDQGQRNALAREFQDIKRPLLAKAFGRGGRAVANGRRIMVTSSLPHEGKTFCAINLALSIAAERDHGVLLVDGDVARPSIPDELDFTARAGLLDWLVNDQLELSDLVLSTNIKRFSILPAGRRHRRANELLASESMDLLMDRLTELFPNEVIVFDSPPLLVTSEAHSLAQHMGQIVMVVAAGETRRSVVAEAVERLGSAPISGVILNKAARRQQAYYGTY